MHFKFARCNMVNANSSRSARGSYEFGSGRRARLLSVRPVQYKLEFACTLAWHSRPTERPGVDNYFTSKPEVRVISLHR